MKYFSDIDEANRELKKITKDRDTAKAALDKAIARLREFELWTPLQDIFIKAGGDPADWEVARLELSSQSQFGFDDDGKVVVMEDGMPSSVTPEKFFKDVYSQQRPRFYKASSVGGGANKNQSSGGKGVKTISADDRDAINNNLEAIAKGEIVVQ